MRKFLTWPKPFLSYLCPLCRPRIKAMQGRGQFWTNEDLCEDCVKRTTMVAKRLMRRAGLINA